MKRLVIAALLGLSAWLVPTAEAQIIGRPGVAGPGFGFGFGYPFGGYGYGGYPFGGVYGPGTLPGQLGIGTTPYNVVPQMVGTTVVTTGTVDLGSPMETGHPTRFAAYSQYFANQGGGFTTPASTTPGYRSATAPVLGAGTGASRTQQGRTSSGATPPAKVP